MANKLQSLIITAIIFLSTQATYADSRVKAIQQKLSELRQKMEARHHKITLEILPQ